MKVQRILILKFRNIGDVLLISPLLRCLKKLYPDAEIDVGINKNCQEVLAENPNIHELMILDREKAKSGSFLSRIKYEVNYIRDIRRKKYDIAINLTNGDRGGLLVGLSGAATKMGYRSEAFFLPSWLYTHLLPEQGHRHTVEMALDVLRALRLPVQDKRVEMFCAQRCEVTIDGFMESYGLKNKRFIHIHPVSRWMFKCINDTTMAQIIDYCEQELQLRVVLTASSVDKEKIRLQNIMKLCKSAPINAAGLLSLTEVASLNRRALAFVGVDTAIMHMSAANDTPVLAFFGPSNPAFWGPWDNDVGYSTYQHQHGSQRMGRHRMITETRPCQPCGRDGCNGSKISDCLMTLDFDMIRLSINEMLHEAKGITHRVV